jgi:hypothetical protein
VKYLIVLLLLAALLGLVYWRLRPYIQLVRRFLGVVREVNQMRPPAASTDLPRRGAGRTPAERTPSEQLVPCAVCGTWVAESRAVTLRATKTTYCSHSCLERAADGPRRLHRNAS